MQENYDQTNELDSYVEEVNAYYEGKLAPYYIGMDQEEVIGVLILDTVEDDSAYGRIFTDNIVFLEELKDVFSTLCISELCFETAKELPEITGLSFNYAEYVMSLLPKNDDEQAKSQLKEVKNVKLITVKDQDRSFYEEILRMQYQMSEEDATKRFDSLLSEENMHGYLVYADGVKLVGIGSYYEGSTFITLFDLTILPEYQNHGYGKALVYQLLEKRMSEHKKYLLQVTSTNEAALHVYKSIGFQITQQQMFYQLRIL